jgi:uncharacterized protein YndB with AHSA1/START domain
MEDRTIIVERVFAATADRVWKAITDKNEMKNWYFDLADFKPEVGFSFQFTGGPSPEKQYIHLCEVTESVHPEKLTYSWRYKGYEGISYVTFDLIPEGNNTRLRLTHKGIDSFPKDNPDLAIENFQKGWDDIINRLLREYLESK